MRRFSPPFAALLGALGLSGCVVISDAEVEEWLAERTCAGGAGGVDAVDCVPYFADDDGDNFGGERSECRCGPSVEYVVLQGGDCDDTRTDVNPGAAEVCDLAGVDEDCDATTLNGESTYFYDSDGDGFGTSVSEVSCGGPESEGFTAVVSGDCDDADAEVHPGAVEVCDGLDNDCSAETSEEGLSSVVGGGVSEDPFDLQATIDGAPEGAVIQVCPRDDYEPVTIPRSMTLVGVGGADATVIVVPESEGGSGIVVGSGVLTLESFTITGGTGSNVGGGRTGGGGVYVVSGAGLVARDTVLRGNYVDGDGGAIYAAGAVRLEGCLVFDNAASEDGGAIYAASGDVAIIDSNLFYNQAGTGAGLYLQGGDIDLTGSRIAGNFGDFGGGVAVVGDATITGGAITSNSAIAGAGVRFEGTGTTLTLSGVSVSDNAISGTSGGGGINVVAGTLVSDRSDWVDDTPEDCPRANTPQDIYTAGGEYCAGDDASFTCTSAGCTGADVTTDCECTR